MLIAREIHSFFSTHIRSIRIEPRRNYKLKDDAKQAGIEKEKVTEGVEKEKFDQSADTGIPKLGAFVSFGLRRGRASWKPVKFE